MIRDKNRWYFSGEDARAFRNQIENPDPKTIALGKEALASGRKYTEEYNEKGYFTIYVKDGKVPR